MKRYYILIALLFGCIGAVFSQILFDDFIPSLETDTSQVVKIGKQQVEITNDCDGKAVNIYFRDKEKRDRHNKFKGHLFGVDLGFNSYMTDEHTTALPEEIQFLDINTSKSIGVTVHVLQESIGLNAKGNLGLVTGIGIEYNNYRFDSKYRLIKSENGNIIYEPIVQDVDKNKLTTCYLTVPLLFEIQGLSKYAGKPAYIAAGLVGGVRLSSHTKIVYNDGEKEKSRGAYNLQDFRYGLMVRTGYRSLNFYGVYYPMSLFKKSGDPQVYPFCVGFSFLPDWM